MLFVYTLTIFVNAMLLFLVQPMFARMVLPMLGGSPAVWNTSLVFFQATLLAGYAYAHAASRWLGVKRQAAVHLGLLCIPLLVLPIAVPAGWTPPAETNPVLWLLALLTVAVGLPFFVVSAGSPLLQKWFAASGHPAAKDPYFLYAASNLGSMIALLGYPVFIEPNLHLPVQSSRWTAGYILLLCLTAVCAVLLWRAHHVPQPETTRSEENSEVSEVKVIPAPQAAQRRRWVMLAFVPSSLMVSVTTYLTTDIAAVPLLWIIPLTIYLLSFIIAFAARPLVPYIAWVRAMPIVMLPLVVAMAARANHPMTLLIPLHLLTLFVVAMVCHGALAEERPATDHLTEFYVWISVGGVLGGAFNALLAPVLFKSVVEYPITLVMACWLGLRPDAPKAAEENQIAAEKAALESRRLLLDFVMPGIIGAVVVACILGLQAKGSATGQVATAIMFGAPAMFAFSFSRRPMRFALAIGVILLASGLLYHAGHEGRILLTDRSFFGVHRVTIDPTGHYRWLIHGNTIHGMESLDEARRGEPLSYYTRSGPVGQVFKALPQSLPRLKEVGVIGLGAGCIAVYAQPGQRWKFYEIDPIVARIASDPNLFTFLSRCRASNSITLGDGRLTLSKAPDHFYDLLVLDAYSSDSLPMHLLTREALQLYLRKLSSRGVLLCNVSNRHLDVEPVIGNLAQEAGLVCLSRVDDVSPEAEQRGKTASQWMVLSREGRELGSLMQDKRWKRARTDDKVGVWTDDYSSILSVFRWQ